MSMENYLLDQIVREIVPQVCGQNVGRIFETSSLEFAISLRRGDNLCLFVSLLPARLGLFLTQRSFKSLDHDRAPGNFTNLMRKYITGSSLLRLSKESNERRV